MVVLLRGETEVARWPLEALPGAGLDVVDGLARLQLAARRLGWGVTLEGASQSLRDVLEVAGLSDVLPVVPAPGRSGGQVLGQPEGGEERGVDEVVVPDDPAT